MDEADVPLACLVVAGVLAFWLWVFRFTFRRHPDQPKLYAVERSVLNILITQMVWIEPLWTGWDTISYGKVVMVASVTSYNLIDTVMMFVTPNGLKNGDWVRFVTGRQM